MSNGFYERTELLVGAEGLERLKAARVLVVGVGGVGAYAAEMVCRAGVGSITIIDADCVKPSNINRQLVALHSTVDKPKVEILGQRLRDINPDASIVALNVFLDSSNIDDIFANGFDYVIDAIDSIAPKVALIEYCVKHGGRRKA